MKRESLWERIEFDGELYFDVRPGASIEDAFLEAWTVFKESGKTVRFQFNGVAVSIWEAAE